MARKTGSTYSTVNGTARDTTINLGFRPQWDQRKCSRVISKRPTIGNSRRNRKYLPVYRWNYNRWHWNSNWKSGVHNLLACYCRLSLCLSVCDEVYCGAQSARGQSTGLKVYRRVSRMAPPIYFFGYFCSFSHNTERKQNRQNFRVWI